MGTKPVPTPHTPDQARKEKTAALTAIIRPLRSAQYETDIMFSHLEQALASYKKDWGGLELDPDFQRGHVWTPAQQRHFIENILRGVVSTSGYLVQFNCPNWDADKYEGDLPRGFQCIDGLQRITAVRKFLAGDVFPFGLSVTDLDDSSYSMNRTLFRFRFAVHNFESRADLLQHYLDLNAGGTPHTDEEIQRVALMLEECVTKPDSRRLKDHVVRDSLRA